MDIIIKKYKKKEDKILHGCGGRSRGSVIKHERTGHYICKQCGKFIPKQVVEEVYRRLKKGGK